MTQTVESIEIKGLNLQHVNIKVIGDTPLIMHAWSEKAKKMMLEAQQGKAKGKKKELKDPVSDFINSMYWIEGKPKEFTKDAFAEAIENGARFGFPATAFKQSGISSAYRAGLVKNMTGLRGAFFIDGDCGDLVEIHAVTPPVIREDAVKIGAGTADLRYRGEFKEWYAILHIVYDANGPYSFENIVNIINLGGYSCGIGEWRPERDGQYGRFHVAVDGE